MKLDEMSDVLNVAEVARVLRVSRDKVYAMVAADELPHKRLGGRIIFVKAKLQEWLER